MMARRERLARRQPRIKLLVAECHGLPLPRCVRSGPLKDGVRGCLRGDPAGCAPCGAVPYGSAAGAASERPCQGQVLGCGGTAERIPSVGEVGMSFSSCSRNCSICQASSSFWSRGANGTELVNVCFLVQTLKTSPSHPAPPSPPLPLRPRFFRATPY